MSEQAKVKFTENTVSEETKINYWNGQQKDLDAAEAERLVSLGKAEYVNPEDAPAEEPASQ